MAGRAPERGGRDDWPCAEGPAGYLDRVPHPTTMTDSPSRAAGAPALRHVDEHGNSRMGDVAASDRTARTAVAAGRVRVGAEALRLIRENALTKGDALVVAQVAGVLGAKQASRLIPLCHDVVLQNVIVEFELDDAEGTVEVRAITKTDGPTGVEMEALTAVSVAALTVYDMCKSVAPTATITDVRLLAKSGGASGDYRRPADADRRAIAPHDN